MCTALNDFRLTFLVLQGHLKILNSMFCPPKDGSKFIGKARIATQLIVFSLTPGGVLIGCFFFNPPGNQHIPDPLFKVVLKMIVLFPSWDMLVPRRVDAQSFGHVLIVLN